MATSLVLALIKRDDWYNAGLAWAAKIRLWEKRSQIMKKDLKTECDNIHTRTGASILEEKVSNINRLTP